MTSAGWIFFSIFWGLVLSLNVFCYSKLFKKRSKGGVEK